MSLSKEVAGLPTITLKQARLLHLHAQGLLQPLRRRARRSDVVAAIERMRLLQIDTIHVVARSPYLVLHSRLGDYRPVWLDEALAGGRLVECWAHEACFVPAMDIALHRGWRAQRSYHWAYRNAESMQRDQRVGMDTLLAGIRDAGPAKAADYANAANDGAPAKSGWWAWKPEKRWLEAWFALGELMVARRENFQRVYDLAENVLARLDPPFDRAAESASPGALRQRFIIDSVRALGVAQAAWIADYYRLRPAVTDKEMSPLLASGELLAIAVSGWSNVAYVHRDHATALATATLGRLRATRTVLLSPFDPVVWDRTRTRHLFDFDYALECYTPEAKRRHGYFVLPILHRGQLIGRLDAKAHRAEKVFEIKTLFLEQDVTTTTSLVKAVAASVAATAQWHGTSEVRVTRTQSVPLTRSLRAALLAVP